MKVPTSHNTTSMSQEAGSDMLRFELTQRTNHELIGDPSEKEEARIAQQLSEKRVRLSSGIMSVGLQYLSMVVLIAKTTLSHRPSLHVALVNLGP